MLISNGHGDQYRNDSKALMHDMDRENRHLQEMMQQKESYYQNLINNLQERVAEQAETIRTHTSTIKAFITRLIPS